jgi:protein involved in polysaccharide export with SLBB domain
MKIYVIKAFCLCALIGAFSSGCSTAPTLPDSIHSLNEVSGDFFVTSTGADNEIANEPVTGKTEIRPGFLIRLKSSDDPGLNKSARVDRTGHLSLPYKVELQAAGLSFESLRAKIQDTYRAYFKKNPSLEVMLEQRKYWVDVRGLVKNPNSYLVDLHTRLDGLLAQAGGLTPENEAQVVQIRRGPNQFFVDLQEYYQGSGLELLPKWRGGESAWFLKASQLDSAQSISPRIQILGEVHTPGSTSFKDGADFFYYLSRTGGPTPTSDLSRIKVVRDTKQGRMVANGSAEEIAKNIKLSHGDMIIVGNSAAGPTERWLQFTSTAAAFVSALGVLILVL